MFANERKHEVGLVQTGGAPHPLPLLPAAPHALGSSEERERHAPLLSEAYMAPLVEYLGRVRDATGSDDEMPSFDPLDGGINARALLLLEAPGPKAVDSALISRLLQAATA